MLGLAGFLGHVVDGRHDLLDGGMRGFERADDLLFRHFLRAGFDHDQAVLAAGHDEVDLALLALFEGRVDQELPVNQTDANARDRLLERNVREGQCRRRAREREDVGVVLGVGREDERDDLRLESPAGGEQRPNRPVDHAAREHFLLGGLALALEEAAGNASRRVGVFAVIDREREEVDALAWAVGAAGGDEHHRVARADNHRAAGLFGQLARFEPDGTLAD